MSYYLINILSNFCITSLIISSLGKEAYSFYPMANNISGWMIIISNAINAMLARHISVKVSKGDLDSANDYYSTAMLADIVVGFLLVIPILIISRFPDFMFEIPNGLLSDVQYLLFTVLMTMPIDMVFTVCSVTWTVKDKLHLLYIGRIIQCLIKFIIILGYFNAGTMKLRSIGYAVFLAEIAFSLYIVFIKKKYMPEIKFKVKNYKARVLKLILSSGIWNSLMQLGNSLLLQFDLIITNIFLGVDAAGTISIATTVPNAITSLVTLLSTMFMPMYFIDYASDNKEEKITKDIQHAQFVVSGIIGMGIVVFVNFGELFFDLWVPGNNSELLLKLSVLYFVPLVISSMFRPVGNACVAYNRMKFQAIMMVFNGLLNAVFMIFLIRFIKMGMIAVVLSTSLISSVWHGIVLPIYVSKIVKVSVLNFYKVPMVVCGLMLIALFVCKILLKFVSMSSWRGLIVGCGTAMIICMTVWLLMYIVVKKEILKKE